jgi:hypothetical protein
MRDFAGTGGRPATAASSWCALGVRLDCWSGDDVRPIATA